MTEEEMREALRLDLRACGLRSRAGEVADALLPTVRRIAAEELRAAATTMDAVVREMGKRADLWAVANQLRIRADALDPPP